MSQFRKKPVVIEAMRWDGTNLLEVIAFTGLHPSAEKWTWGEYEAVVAKDGLKIFTLEGPLMASVGDWIIRGVKGEFYPCKPDIFAATYEPAAAPASGGRDWTQDAWAQLTTARDALQGVVAAWNEHWDCSASPGHGPVEEAIGVAREVLDEAAELRSRSAAPAAPTMNTWPNFQDFPWGECSVQLVPFGERCAFPSRAEAEKFVAGAAPTQGKP